MAKKTYEKRWIIAPGYRYKWDDKEFAVLYDTLEEATLAAKRMAKTDSSQEYFIMESVAVAVREYKEVEETPSSINFTKIS